MNYTIGLDFGTQSARGVLVSCTDGQIISASEMAYPHGVIDRILPSSGQELPKDWALQDPQDYLIALEIIVKKLLDESRVASQDIIGIAIDFTSCTLLAVDAHAVPLCQLEKFRDRPHAYAKLWKHHGAQAQADRVNEYLDSLSDMDRTVFGGKVSSELFLPKVLQLLDEDPELYNEANEFLEAGDWLTRLLTGRRHRSNSMASYKAWWDGESYPAPCFYSGLDPRLSRFVEDKMPGRIVKVGSRIGRLTEEWGKRLSLRKGIAVSPSLIDSHCGVAGSGVYKKNQQMLVVGTSSVIVALNDRPFSGQGVLGTAKDTIVPGYYALESGIAAVGDMFAWYMENLLPYRLYREAKDRGEDLFTFMTEKVYQLPMSEDTVIALDWWGGNKTPYVDAQLAGLFYGMGLTTKPEELFRAMIEASAFGTRQIFEVYEKAGVEVDEIVCSGGIARKNRLIMQTYADVLSKDLRLVDSDWTAAIGASIYAALAAGEEAGGYNHYPSAVQKMAPPADLVIKHDKDRQKYYNNKYEFYRSLSEKMISLK